MRKHTDSSITVIYFDFSKSKVLRYFDEVRHNLAALGAFAEILKGTNYTRI